MGTWEEIKVMCNTLDGSTSRAQNSGKIQCAMCMRRRLFRVCILPLIACLPLWAGEMRVRRSKTSRVEMKVDYLSLCYRGSDNPAFIWFCDFLSKASRLSCNYQDLCVLLLLQLLLKLHVRKGTVPLSHNLRCKWENIDQLGWASLDNLAKAFWHPPRARGGIVVDSLIRLAFSMFQKAGR